MSYDKSKPGCVIIDSDGVGENTYAFFHQALSDPSVTEVVLAAPRFQLKVPAWRKYTAESPLVLRRNFTVRSSVQPYGLMDFRLLENKVLIAAGVVVEFRSIVLQNVRKLGGFGLDFFMGEAGSYVHLVDTVRIKLACQLPTDALASASSYKTLPGFPNNSVILWDEYCVDAAITQAKPTQHCFQNVLHFANFTLLATNNDPDRGNQFPGYIIYQRNTTRACQSTITLQCLQDHGKSLQDVEDGSSQWVTEHAVPLALGHYLDSFASPSQCQDTNGGSSSIPSYLGRRAISQQVTLGVLLGAGSFGRVYRGRWHSSDVAIKIMSCTPDELSKVLREAEAREERTHSKSVLGTGDQSPSKPSGSNPGQLISQALQASSSTSGKGSSSQLHRAANAVLTADGMAADNADDRAAASDYLDIVPQPLHTSAPNADCDPLPGMLCDRPALQAAHTGWKAGKAAPVASGGNETAGDLVRTAGLTVGVGSNAQELGASGSPPLPWTPDACEEPSTAADAMASSSTRKATASDSTVGYSRQLVDEGVQQLPTAMAVAQVWIVLELCNGGTLKDAVASGYLKVDSKMELAKMLSRLLDAAAGMAYLHSKGVMHGDLKAGNVLLHSATQSAYGQVAKISDFGLAAVLLDGATHRSTASMGTITHCAPEMLRSGHMSPAADVYSFGIMMWELYTNKPAYKGMHYGAVVERVVVQQDRPAIPDHMPEEFALLMRACWDPDPAHRPSFNQIITCLELMLDNLSSEPGSDDEDGQTVSDTSATAGRDQALPTLLLLGRLAAG
eukprot:gene6955-7171_t